MIRKLACVGVLLALSAGLVIAEEFNVAIRKIEGSKITATKGAKFNKDTKKLEGGTEITLEAVADVKILSGKKVKGKVEIGDALKGGLKSEVFSKIGENGVGAQVTTNDDGKVTQIVVTGGKKPKKDAN